MLTPVWRSTGKAVAIPMLKAFSALDETKQNGQNARVNKANDGTVFVPSEYLEIVITKP